MAAHLTQFAVTAVATADMELVHAAKNGDYISSQMLSKYASTCEARSATSPGRPRWSRLRAWRSMKRVSMKTISGPKSSQAIKSL